MGLFSDLAGAAISGLQQWNAEAEQHYERASELDDDKLRSALRSALNGSNKAKKAGYIKAARERGLMR